MTEQLTPTTILALIGAYFLVLIGISYWTSKRADSNDFFIAGRQSPWLLVAIGMIGASLSGVTFISIPGQVGANGLNMSFSYMQVVFGYLVGYFVIGAVLLPLYYRYHLTSIYGYLENRFGFVSYQTGAAFFLLSRIVGASFRLFLVALVLQTFVLDALGIPFELTVLGTILLIWTYTFNGGIKTIVWTDTLQTVCMLLAVFFTILAIGNAMDIRPGQMIGTIQASPYKQMFFFEGGWSDPNNFFKQFFSGALLAIVMTGLDQDMMQKNLSCRTLRDAQKNMFTFCIILIFANLLFLGLGALLYIYADFVNLAIPEKTDTLYPLIALEYLPPYISVLFLLGLIAAAYSSADSALTSLTTSFCVDFLGFEKKERSEKEKRRIRLGVHIGFSLILLLVIIAFNQINNDAVINNLFIASGYTYGPLLGLFTFGLVTKRSVQDRWVWIICLAAPLLTYVLNINSADWFNGFKFGFLLLALNGLLTFTGLWLISSVKK